ncbi:hypothetical protein Ae168Ps1_5898 [Pseudonocardia sp. Ae168_Ps1]|uniref:hypothetical protein n=1 Tax=unclassified Pseudonocardia TaxID=2619320 RepID=UPI00094AD545|nr:MULTISPECIES: hypothetical protein [unclassified Pseudonocardia]OLL71395.1 hypothetical protein Ae168Ps1_5898 [Pseudonocardia sp. Ae168_Ps1]OLL77058.1 hypothetical protein Ae150APs1_5436c [Pseudonocardia sp. Ae150A_Ps1]OLL88831.1 hypothetical protein Ae263Ps1_5886 [Pseudonocardia sp. Ae263_Ps1]OLL91143.1 hypothetical protein Ae356Ps1_1040c [Pseudonocardia sp. Ae356_Ps1]
MDLRRVTGYIALGLLALYLLWLLSRTAPELRKSTRGRHLRAQVLAVRLCAVALAGLFVGLVHFWATAWWQVIVAVPVTFALATGLRRIHRKLVALPRHRVPLAQRVRRTGHFQVIREPGSSGPHRHAAGELGTAPFVVPGAEPDTAVPPDAPDGGSLFDVAPVDAVPPAEPDDPGRSRPGSGY